MSVFRMDCVHPTELGALPPNPRDIFAKMKGMGRG